MIIGIGTDIIEINRIEKLINESRFLERFFTESEREYIKQRKPESAAGYFCAKEAVSKALGCGFSGIKFTDIEIVKINSVPHVLLHGNALKIANSRGIKNIFVSISHCRNYAVATVVAEG